MKEEDKKIKKRMKYIWKRTYFKEGGVLTSHDWEGKKNKEDMMDCIEDLMEDGGIGLIDLLNKFSPKKR